MPIEPLLLFLAGAALLIGIVYWAQRQREKRRDALAAWAATKGFAFSAEKDRGMDERFDAFELFREGGSRYAYNICSGTVSRGERSVYAFDYHYTTQTVNAKGQTENVEHEISVVVVSTPYKLRQLTIRTESFFDKIGEFFGMDDIDFELAEFNSAFHVRASDRRWAFDVLHQKAMEFMLSAPRFTLEFNEGRVLAHRNSELSVKELDDALFVVNGLLDILPASVVRELSDSR